MDHWTLTPPNEIFERFSASTFILISGILFAPIFGSELNVQNAPSNSATGRI